jgi:hypothetical protein
LEYSQSGDISPFANKYQTQNSPIQNSHRGTNNQRTTKLDHHCIKLGVSLFDKAFQKSLLI